MEKKVYWLDMGKFYYFLSIHISYVQVTLQLVIFVNKKKK